MRPLEDLLVTTVNFPFLTIDNCTLGGHGDRDVHAVAHRYNSSSECSPTQVNRRALESGADDYVLKPFSPTELIARVRAALRRRVEPNPFMLGDLTITLPSL